MSDIEAERRARAEARRAAYPGAIVAAGAPKPDLYEGTSVAERLAAMTRLSETMWKAGGRPLPPRSPRSEWPGEIFEVGR